MIRTITKPKEKNDETKISVDIIHSVKSAGSKLHDMKIKCHHHIKVLRKHLPIYATLSRHNFITDDFPKMRC